ncbi:hypothetical protein [Methylocaldum sp. RMAD-M]|uniref:hypothetical protein n=1 Tax=Methylocaldum sp. RMAD-M TaxID=2806557 RepID=UPI001B69D0AA|nr:hypothetical protein [Methylocaldum sp. RMAD-M]MBP1149210.1 hypothetical protein [Methylocaldum sp. RMAD-M]
MKYRSQHPGARELKGLIQLCTQKKTECAYVVTKSPDDIGPLTGLPPAAETDGKIIRLPAPLLCYWMGASELNQHEMKD